MVQATDDIEAMEESLPQALKLLGEMSDSAEMVSSLVDVMLDRVRSGELSTEFGLSFLEVKYHSLLDYLINLMHVVLRKCSGGSIEKDPSIDRLLELRTTLEKIRPIDFKLRYQIDKLVKTVETGQLDPDDISNFKARPDLLMSQLGDEDSEADSEDDEQHPAVSSTGKGPSNEGSKIYRPPKLNAMPYEADDDKSDKRKKQMERARKRALGSSIIQEMKEQYTDAPIEIKDINRAQETYSNIERRREQYEEDNFMRLPVTKADKQRQRRLTTMGVLGDEITSFRDISALTGGFKEGEKKGKKRKMGGKHGKGKKKGGGKKKKFH